MDTTEKNTTNTVVCDERKIFPNMLIPCINIFTLFAERTKGTYGLIVYGKGFSFKLQNWCTYIIIYPLYSFHVNLHIEKNQPNYSFTL